MKRGTFQQMKSVNKSLVLNKIRTSEPISRAQIAKETKLTPPTVSSIVKELMNEKLVTESNFGESHGGRKPKMLLINKNAFYIIGVDAGPDSIKSMAGNLSGKSIVRSETKKIAHPITEDEFVELLIDSVRAILEALPNPDKIMGIGVAMHGVVYVEQGLSLIAPNLGLRNIPIKDILENEFDMIVKVENDVRAMALGESWFGKYGHIGSMLMVNMGSGVGAGLVIDGKLYHGASDLAGEVGHMTIDVNGDMCTCGNRGCFQTFATSESLVKRARTALVEAAKADHVNELPLAKDVSAQPSTGDQSGQKTLNNSQLFVLGLTDEEIYNMACAGNETLNHVLRETGEIVGIALTNLIHVINPDLIVLGGEVSNTEEYILPIIRETIEQRGLTTEAKQTKVVVTELGDDATLMGAMSLLLIELFEAS